VNRIRIPYWTPRASAEFFDTPSSSSSCWSR